jgi:hypothetical protein
MVMVQIFTKINFKYKFQFTDLAAVWETITHILAVIKFIAQVLQQKTLSTITFEFARAAFLPRHATSDCSSLIKIDLHKYSWSSVLSC